MKILIDADGCPVTDIAIHVAKQSQTEVMIFCDTSHNIEKKGAVTNVISKGADAVDFALVNQVSAGDIVITQDYGLAAMVLSKRAYPINQNGLIYTEDNINQLLFTRHLAKKVRSHGGRIKGPKKRKTDNDNNFQEALAALISKALNTL